MKKLPKTPRCILEKSRFKAIFENDPHNREERRAIKAINRKNK